MNNIMIQVKQVDEEGFLCFMINNAYFHTMYD